MVANTDSHQPDNDGLIEPEYKTKPILPLASRQTELLAEAWDAALSVTGLDAPFDENDMRSSLAGILKQMARCDLDMGADRVIEGGADEVAMKLASMAGVLGDDPGELIGFLAGVCANSLAVLQEKWIADEEELVDASVEILRHIKISGKTTVDGILKLVPRLRGLLAHDPEQDEGWYKSILSLGAILSSVADQIPKSKKEAQDARLLGGVYSHTVLAAAAKGIAGALSADAIKQAANNLSVTLSRLSRGGGASGDSKPGEDPIKATIRNLETLFVVANMKEEGEEEENKVELISDIFGILPLLSGPKISASELLRLLNGVTRVTSREEKNTLHQALLHAMAGAALAELRERNLVASSFFNAGAEIRRIQKHQEMDFPETRAIINALGLFWTINLNGDPVSALVDGNGFDCAVNLFGALTELEPVKIEKIMDGGGGKAANFIRGCLNPSKDREHAMHLMASFRELPFTTAPETEPATMDELLKSSTELVSTLVRELKPDFKGDISGQLDSVKTAEIVMSLFPKDQLPKLMDEIKELLSPYIKLAGSSLKELASELYDKDLQDNGPFVTDDKDWSILGVEGDDEGDDKKWEKLKEKSEIGCQSIGDAFSESFPTKSENSDAP